MEEPSFHRNSLTDPDRLGVKASRKPQMPGRNAASDNLKSSCDCEREGQAFAFLLLNLLKSQSASPTKPGPAVA